MAFPLEKGVHIDLLAENVFHLVTGELLVSLESECGGDLDNVVAKHNC